MATKGKLRRFAENTTVPVDRSRLEIESLLRRHGAAGIATSWDKDRYTLLFDLRKHRVRFDVPAPDAKTYRDTKRWHAEERRRWRALLLIVKAKLELVASGDTDFEAEFLAHLVIGGQTIAERLLPQLAAAIENGVLPPLLTSGGAT